MPEATLAVTRDSARDLKIRGVEILLDGRFVGNLNYGESLDVPIEPGPHTLTATNRLKSKSAEFEAKPEEVVRFRTTGIAMGGIWAVMAMLGTVAYRVELERLPD
ncbi:MAG TPA: hypothetical protein VHE55_03285 [Fimbriimonadaceae bacterium]|nr:hypothetical protein [Fimbriimonadaceae bacterium]